MSERPFDVADWQIGSLDASRCRTRWFNDRTDGAKGMRFSDLVKQCEWEGVWLSLESEYPSLSKGESVYRDLFHDLIAMEPVDSSLAITVEWVEDGEDSFHHVSALDDSESAACDSERYSIALTEWAEWLGMDVAQSTLEAYTTSQIVAHCLWEMTWFGANLEAVRAARKQIRESLDEVAKEKGRPFEEFMAEMESYVDDEAEREASFGKAVDDVLTKNDELYGRLSK